MFTVIAENDESKWDDSTGVLYHFPLRYLKFLQPGTKVVYYKGSLKNKAYKNKRLSPQPHYFGIAITGKNYKDPKSGKNDYYCEIENFIRFSKPVLAKIDTEFIEKIPTNRITNYWRDGVRQIDERIYTKIIDFSDLSENQISNQLNDNFQGSDESFTSFEGNSKNVITTKYERDPRLREQAIRIHGLSCMVCGFNFEETYGDWGIGFIHVHHIKPISEAGFKEVKPKEDLVVLCANCHSMIHRKKNRILEIHELKSIMKTKTVS